MGEIYSTIWEIMEELCERKIEENLSLFGDLEMDSVQIIELVLEIEERYGFEFEEYDELMEHMETVRDFIIYFESYINNMGS